MLQISFVEGQVVLILMGPLRGRCVCVFVCLCAEIGMKYSDTTKQSVQNEAMFLCTYQKKNSAVIYQ